MLRLNLKTRSEWLDGLDWGKHHMGTTRMHVDPHNGVVDANSQVHGVSNLFVAGSSVFPTYGASNPTMNLVALTLRLADHLKGVLR
jgi:choline dehydrogenase-like flavoprotein